MGTGGSTQSTTGSSATSGSQNGTSSTNSGGTTNVNQNSSGTTISNPNLSQQFTQMQNGIPSQYNQLMYNASKPLYGQNQQTSFMGNLNQAYSQQSNQLMSQLAKRGALNSGGGAAALTGLATNKLGQQSNYLAQAPVLNQQYMNSTQGNLLGQGMGYKPLTGTTQTSSNQMTSLTDVQNFLNSLFNSNSNSNTNSSSTTKDSGTGLMGALGL